MDMRLDYTLFCGWSILVHLIFLFLFFLYSIQYSGVHSYYLCLCFDQFVAKRFIILPGLST